jgi:riboflavin biosynthesis pyrimidine reductase
MSVALTALETLFDGAAGAAMPLGPDLLRLYGQLRFDLSAGRPLVIGNFVSTLDGVTALEDPKLQGGAEISGYNAHDRMVMGVLRSVAGAVVVGAGTLRADGKHVWTPRHIFGELAPQFAEVRQALGLAPVPLNVFVTGRGEIDFSMRVFQSAEAPVLVVTTDAGAERMRKQQVPALVRIETVGGVAAVTATDVLAVVQRIAPSRIVLVEGGPHLLSDFFAERRLDELFLTLAPQLGGRNGAPERPGFVAGHLFSPLDQRWGTLLSVRRADSHLFLRYSFGDAAKT